MGLSGADLVAHLTARGVGIPDGHVLVTLSERPDLEDAIESFGSSVWPEFMLHDPVADGHWPRLATDWPEFQIALLDGSGAVAAVGRSAPLRWDGTLEDLPAGWDDQFTRSVAELERDVEPNTLGAIMIVTDSARRGERLGGLMVSAFQACGRAYGFGWLIACVRPTALEYHPDVAIAEYVCWTRDDGLPYDPWIRIHVRLGGRLSRPEPRSMAITGTVAEWEAWTGRDLPSSGSYVVAGASAPVAIDREADLGTYHDPNVWVIHDLA